MSGAEQNPLAVFDREIAELETRLAVARRLRREVERERRDAHTRAMYAWLMADPARTLEDTARKFGLPRATISSRFWKRGLYAIGPQHEARARAIGKASRAPCGSGQMSR